jgi:hypothetical protein
MYHGLQFVIAIAVIPNLHVTLEHWFLLGSKNAQHSNYRTYPFGSKTNWECKMYLKN